MDFLNEALIGAVAGAAGLLLAKGIDFFKARKGENREDKKTDAGIEQSETSLALAMYKDLIEGLKKDTKELLGHLHLVEKDHLASREENATLRAELKNLEEDLKRERAEKNS